MDKTSAPKKEPEIKQETLLSWESPARLFKKRDGEFFKTIGVILFLLAVILVFAKEFLLILALMSIAFFVYTLSTVPPEDVKHKITNLGIETDGKYYRWEQIVEFWFEEQWDQKLLIFRPALQPRVIILLGSVNKDQVKRIISSHIPFREDPKKSWVDNAAVWLKNKIPLES